MYSVFVPVLYIFSPYYHLCNEKKSLYCTVDKLFYIVFIAEFILILFYCTILITFIISLLQ